MQGLNYLLANRSQLVVLRTLYKAESPVSGRAVEKASGLSNRATMMALHTLTDANAVHCAVLPGRHCYSLNHNHYLVAKALKPAFEAEEMFWNDVHKTVRRIVKPRPNAAVATGPLAREENEYGGRVTLIMLFSSGSNRIKSLASIQKLAQAFRDRYSLTLEHYLMDPRTMNRPENEPLWNRIEREGILLFGSLP